MYKLVRKALNRQQDIDSHNEAKSFDVNRLAPQNIQGAVGHMSSLQLHAPSACIQGPVLVAEEWASSF